jgi:peptide/nickel transport system substrate-binding protein
MINRTTKLRWRRRFRSKRRQVEGMSVQAEEGLERHFFKRIESLVRVRRFVASWLALLLLLIAGSIYQLRSLSQYYQKLAPVPGGTFYEGIIGTFTNANPIFASTPVDTSVSQLVFSGLMKYDEENRLVGDLAEDITVNDTGQEYKVILRPNLKWHDGHDLTSEDVAFTYKTIQNPDTRSPFFNSWKGIIIETPDARTVIFRLPSSYSAFGHGLTRGIVPKHLLKSVPVEQLRTARFNTVELVGAGPFRFDAIEVAGTAQNEREERIGLVPFGEFHRGPPKLQQFVIRTFRDENQMLEAYKKGELNSMVGLASLSDDIRSVPSTNEHYVSLAGAAMVFFKTTVEPFTDVEVRKALVQAVNVPEATQTLGYPTVLVKGPLLNSHIGFNKNITQLSYDQEKAKKLLDKAGWKEGDDGVRRKGGAPLTFSLFAQNTSDYVAITGYLQKAWKSVGVDLKVMLQSDSDIQGVVSRHDYDALLYGISLGSDPDVFPYWHSSQTDPRSVTRLNLSEYKSKVADTALEAGRTRSDPAVRTVKYKPFLEAWRDDAPALALYQPQFLYVTRGELFNFEPKVLNSAADRYANIDNWMIRQEKITK